MNDIIIIIILIILINEYKNHTICNYINTESMTSNTDLRKYKIISGMQNPKEAVNKMAMLNNFMLEFLRKLKTKFLVEKKGHRLEKEFVKRVIKNYNPDVIFENNPRPGEETSFVTNKGENFGICLRNKTNNDLHRDNILKFVIIHELTHLGTTTYGHDYQFWSWMKFMVTQAYLFGMYEPIDYSKNPKMYCGDKVNDNPYYNPNFNWLSPKAN